MKYFVYLLVSRKYNRLFSYVGITNDLKKRVNLHNSSKGAMSAFILVSFVFISVSIVRNSVSFNKPLIFLFLFLNEDLFLLAEKEVKKIEFQNSNLDKYFPLIKLYDRADIINDLV